MSGLPVRLRLTLVFVAVMAVVLVASGLFLYFRTAHALDQSVGAELHAREASLRVLTARATGSLANVIPPGESVAQLVRDDGRVLDSRPRLEAPMLRPDDLAAAARREITVDRGEAYRFLAGPVRIVGGGSVVLVVGASLTQREETLDGLRGALFVGLPVALLVAAAIGYAVAAGALAPVEAIRRRAETIVRADPDARVPVPEADDEIRRLAGTLNDMLQRLEQTAAQERAFAASASHELRTPLTALNAELDLARRHARSADELRAAIERCQEDTRRLIALAESLLVLARAEDGPVSPRQPVQLERLLDDVAAGGRAEAAVQGRELRVAADGIVAELDAPAVARAVRNLVDNALIHGRGDVTVSAELANDGCVVVSVRDEGRLEDPEVPARAFERFFRGRNATGRPGSGLGLALVQVVAEQHGGTATLAPGRDGGTCAQIRLPVRPA